MARKLMNKDVEIFRWCPPLKFVQNTQNYWKWKEAWQIKKFHVIPPPKTNESWIKVKEELRFFKICHTCCVPDLAVGTKDQALEAGNPREEEIIPLGLDALDNLFKEKVK